MNTLVLPESQLPSPEILNARGRDYSDLFPYMAASDSHSILGNYMMQGPMSELRPLWPIIKGVSEYRSFAQPQQPPHIIAGQHLLMHTVRCIDQAYSNLTKEGRPPLEATDIINDYITDRDQAVANRYDDELDRLISAQALAVPDDLYGHEITTARLRVQRLRFEWMAAVSITGQMKESL